MQNCEWRNGLQEEYWQGYLDFIEQQSLKKQGNKRSKKESSCRKRPLEITVSSKTEERNTSKDEKKELLSSMSGNDEDGNTKDGDEEDNIFNANEVYWRIYFGGMEASLRSKVTFVLLTTNHVHLKN